MREALAAICPGCFRHKGGPVPLCPTCKYDTSAPRSPFLLPVLIRLHSRYLIGKPLGRPGGFGVTYLGFDLTLRAPVAIKEYCPRDLVARDTTEPTQLIAHSEEDDESFHVGLKAFLEESHTLARFTHPHVVRVRDFFEANNTAYIVMDYYEGEVLNEYLNRQGGKLPWRAAITLMLPIIDALREVHQQGFLHRDVKPQNIYLTKDGKPILLDFGAARQVMGERSRSLSIMLTEGYAPFEQYYSRGQGPWTDIYGVAATLYFIMTGQTPPSATERKGGDTLIPPQTLLPEIPPILNAFMLHALAVDPDKRTQEADLLYKRLVAVMNGFTGFESNLLNTTAHKPIGQNARSDAVTVRGDAPTVRAFPVAEHSRATSNSFVYKFGAFFAVMLGVAALAYWGMQPSSKQKPIAHTISPKTPADVWLRTAARYHESGEHAQARFWFEKSAEEGNAEAQYQLGVLYLEGKATQKDEAQASVWLQKAADQGHEEAAKCLTTLPSASKKPSHQEKQTAATEEAPASETQKEGTEEKAAPAAVEPSE